MSDEYGMTYAHHDSLEGLLQRGRGLGAVRALQVPEKASEFVYDGIRRDWRWDGVDDRSLYLARLVRDLRLPLAPIVDRLTADEDSCLRACEVLELLALAGSDEAREALRAHVREGGHWVQVMESVSLVWPPEWWEDLGDVARARMGKEAELPWLAEPWTRFGIEVQRHPCAARPSLAGLGTGELLALLSGDHAEDDVKFDALRELNGRGPTGELIALVPSLGSRNSPRPLPGLVRAVERLGAAAVPAARSWAADDRPWLARLGADVLADHAGPEVLPGLVEELAAQWAARAWCGPDRTARRLARFGPAAAGAVPHLRRLWLRTPHSYERTAYLEALAAMDRDGLDHAYTESLWDCEETARLLGTAAAPAHPDVLERVAVLRDDPMETADVRSAARTRLAGLDRLS
ncbi:hypothetical protein [Streptomyces fructofermentans]|uniref:hypothetical protein n=1 Tax=Streptomyces fructofermentans TaxID=152141 RepID=UPI0033E3D27D